MGYSLKVMHFFTCVESAKVYRVPSFVKPSPFRLQPLIQVCGD